MVRQPKTNASEPARSGWRRSLICSCSSSHWLQVLCPKRLSCWCLRSCDQITMFPIVIYDVSQTRHIVGIEFWFNYSYKVPEKEFYASISDSERIAWIWAIVFALAVPEIGTMIRAARICFFRNIRKSTWNELLLVTLITCFKTIYLS